MSHRTLVNGTAYEISGGKTLVNGTAYSIDKGKTLVGGTAYEVGFSLPCTVTIKSQVLGPQPQIFNKAYVTIDGQAYKAKELTQSSESAKDVATLVVPSGTVIHCYSEGGGTLPGSISVNGGSVGTANGLITEYDYIVNGNIEVLLESLTPNGMMYMTNIFITEL